MSRSLVDALRSAFVPPVIARGEAYHRERRVTIVDSSNDGVFARVRGGEEYSVTIEWDASGRTQCACSCPFSAGGIPCKHMWATLLEAAGQTLLPTVTSTNVRLTILSAAPQAEPDEDDESDEVDFEDDASEPDDERSVWPESARAATRPPPRTGWESTLRMFSGYGVPEAPTWTARSGGERQLVWVLDETQSRAQGIGLMLESCFESRKKNGEWTIPKPLGIESADFDSLADDVDRAAARILLASKPVATGSWGYSTPAARARFIVSHHAIDLVIRPLCAAGRLRLRTQDGARQIVPLVWDDAGAWELRFAIAREKPHTYMLAPVLVRGAERLPIDVRETGDAATVLLPEGLVIRGATAAPLTGAANVRLAETLIDRPIVIAEPEIPELLAELFAIPTAPPVDLPPELGFTTTSFAPAPRVEITEPKRRYGYDASKAAVALWFDYGEKSVRSTNVRAALADVSERRVIRRDTAAEHAATAFLLSVGVRREVDYSSGAPVFRVLQTKVVALQSALLAAGWRVTYHGVPMRTVTEWSVEVTTGIDWFDLAAAVDFGDQRATLPALLDALRRGASHVTLADGSVGVIPTDVAARIAPLARLGDATDDRIRFTRGQAGFLDVLLTAIPSPDTDAQREHVRAELRRFDGIAPRDATAGFTGTLRGYQREGLGWLDFLRDFGLGGCLADDMGLGKTVQVLALLESRRAAGLGPSLVVVPKSLVFNWRSEAARFTPELRVLDHSGTGRRAGAEHFELFDLILTTYGTLRRDAKDFREVLFDYVILDEAQAIKNASTESAKAARVLRANHRLALSGTPVQNHIGELWSLFEFLNPGMLGEAAAFKQLGAMDANGAHGMLSRAMRPYILRRTKEQVAPELPEKTEQTVYVDLDDAERALYDELRDHYRATLLQRIRTGGLAKARMHVLEALLRLRQAACHTGLLDSARAAAPSSKVAVLLDQIDDVVQSGHKALVFSQFTSLLALVRPHLDAAGVVYEYLDGKTRDREARVTRFQSDDTCPLFLISLKAGGLGLNLTGADYVFLLDPWWNPAVEAQAIDRAHRIGQTRRVFASRLIARDTVEERVLELQETKRALADAIIGEDNGALTKIGVEEIEMLLR